MDRPPRLDPTEGLRRASLADREAFGAVVEEYQVAVYNLCYRMLGDHHLAEDAAQETFLRAFRSRARQDPNRPTRTWLLSIAAHHCIDQLRRRALLTWLPLGERNMVEPAAGPEARLVRSESEQEVGRLLRQLKPPERAAIVLRYWYDMSIEEIAAILQITSASARTRLHRARKELAALQPGIAGELNHEPRTI
jgi:RNA polymerase sigma-70 factor (ECF subfamily)